MAESEATKKDENKPEVADDNGESGLSNVLKKIGITLKWLLSSALLLHMHFILCCCFPVSIVVEDRCSKRIADICERIVWTLICFAPSATTIFVVIMINNVDELYPEIQSWQIAYITWGVCVSIAGWIHNVILGIVKGDDADDAEKKVARWLLKPFGIKPSDAGYSSMWSIPLVSFAPSMVSGFLANFFLEPEYLFACDESKYDSISDVCFDDEGVCCMAISSHTQPITFMATLASTILAAWGVIKTIGYLICVADDEVVIDNKAEEDKTKAMVKSVMQSQSIRKMMSESIDLAEKEETKKAESEAGSADTKV